MITHIISSADRNAVINEQDVQNSTEDHTWMFWKFYFVEKFSSEYALDIFMKFFVGLFHKKNVVYGLGLEGTFIIDTPHIKF